MIRVYRGVYAVGVDAYFPEHRLVAELDGWGPHRTKQAFVNDRRQDFAILAETGIPTVRLPSEDVVDAVIPQLRKALSLASKR